MNFIEVVEDWKSNDEWRYADKEAAWKFFFAAGKESSQAVISAQCVKMSQYERIIFELRKQLAAEQLNNKRLRGALEAVIKVHGYESGIPVEAISTQASTEALDKYVAEKVKKAGKFDMWKTNPYTKVLETSIKQLTKQRDLAVEVLKTAYEVATNHDDRLPFNWAVYCEMLWQAIKESEAK